MIQHILLSAPRDNQQTVRQNPEVVTAYILAELDAGRLAGPIPYDIPGLHCSPIRGYSEVKPAGEVATDSQSVEPSRP